MIAITYDKNTNTVFQHFGKTEYFYLFNKDNDEKRIIDNGGYSHHNLANYLKSNGVDTLICGGIGNHGVDALNELGIKLIPGVIGDVKNVISDYKEGKLVSNFNAIHECSHHLKRQ